MNKPYYQTHEPPHCPSCDCGADPSEMGTTGQTELEMNYTALLEAVKEACKMMRRCDYTPALSLLLTTLWEIENNG